MIYNVTVLVAVEADSVDQAIETMREFVGDFIAISVVPGKEREKKSD